MQVFTLNPTNNTITEGIVIKEYTVEGHKLTGVDVGIFNKPNSTTLKVFNIYGSKDAETVTEIAPIYKAVRYHPDRKYLSAAKIITNEVCGRATAMVYFNADVPSSRANLFNTEELYTKGVFYAGRKLDTETRTNRFGKEYVYESLPAVLVVDKDVEYKYATFIENKKHIVTFKYDGTALTIVKDDVVERKPRPPRKPYHANAITEALADAIRKSGETRNFINLEYTETKPADRKRNKKNKKWEVNRKESRWN